MHKIEVSLCLFVLICAAAGQSRRDIPPAPLPSVVVNAKKVFLTNGGGSDLAYDTFYSEIKKWGKYEVIGSPDDADLINSRDFLPRRTRRHQSVEHAQQLQRNHSGA